MADILTRHGTCIAVEGQGVLLLGSPGSGKSSLALRMMDAPGYGLGPSLLKAELVADDQVVIAREGGLLLATAPASLRGKLEVRGLGILPVTAVAKARLALVAQLQPVSTIERLPETQSLEILGVKLPAITLDASLPAAPAILRAALASLVKPA